MFLAHRKHRKLLIYAIMVTMTDFFYHTDRYVLVFFFLVSVLVSAKTGGSNIRLAGQNRPAWDFNSACLMNFEEKNYKNTTCSGDVL